VQKLFETANIKLDSVVSDLFGVTGRNLMSLLVSGHTRITREDIEQCVRGRLKNKTQELYRSIQGFFTEHHRSLLQTLLSTISAQESTIAMLDQHIRQRMSAHEELIERMKEVPGISDVTVREILAEIGTTLDTFPSAQALARWAGLCPGNNESAGKQKNGKKYASKNYIKPIMIETAWAATRTNNTYYQDKYHRLKSRCGHNRAITAIAHRIIQCLYYIIRNDVRYHELGMDYLDKKTQRNRLSRLQKQAQSLGYALIPVSNPPDRDSKVEL
jgi:hypothetical protein